MQNDAQTLDTVQTPSLLLDEARLRANVHRMKAHLAGLGVGFRPHLKTAKSLDVARIAMTSPEGPAMVSTLREAEYFAEGGVRDMVYGVGIAPGKLARVSAIRARGVDLAVTVALTEMRADVAAGVWGDGLRAFSERLASDPTVRATKPGRQSKRRRTPSTRASSSL